MQPKEKLRQARERAGKTLQEVAHASGLTLPAYCDMEDFDDELYQAVALADIRRVAACLGMRMEALFDGPRLDGREVAGFNALADGILAHLRAKSLSLAEFEKKVGWELATFLQDAESAWKDWNVDCLRDVCRELGIQWLSVLKSE